MLDANSLYRIMSRLELWRFKYDFFFVWFYVWTQFSFGLAAEIWHNHFATRHQSFKLQSNIISVVKKPWHKLACFGAHIFILCVWIPLLCPKVIGSSIPLTFTMINFNGNSNHFPDAYNKRNNVNVRHFSDQIKLTQLSDQHTKFTHSLAHSRSPHPGPIVCESWVYLHAIGRSLSPFHLIWS